MSRGAPVDMDKVAKKIAQRTGLNLKETAAATGMEYNEAKRAFSSGVAKVTLQFLKSSMGEYRPGDVERDRKREEALSAIKCANLEQAFNVVMLFADVGREKMMDVAWFKDLPEEARDHIEEAIESLERCQDVLLEELKKEKGR